MELLEIERPVTNIQRIERLRTVVLLIALLGSPFLLQPTDFIHQCRQLLSGNSVELLLKEYQQHPFNPTPLDALNKLQPEFVFIGDSMLETRIDPGLFNEIVSPRKAYFLATGGSASLQWYLKLKNYAAAASQPPRFVFILFRDYDLTNAGFRIRDHYVTDIGHAATVQDYAADGELVRVLSHLSTGWRAQFYSLLDQGFDLPRRKRELEGVLKQIAFRLAPTRYPSRHKLEKRMAAKIFVLRNLRVQREPDVTGEVEKSLQDFGSNVHVSFVPLMIDIANQKGIRLVFVRVDRRPFSNGTRQQTMALSKYTRDMVAYITANGADFHDLAMDSPVDLAYYGSGDHIAPQYFDEYTRYFVRRLNGYFR